MFLAIHIFKNTEGKIHIKDTYIVLNNCRKQPRAIRVINVNFEFVPGNWYISHHRKNEEQQCTLGQRDLQTHSNASIEKFYQIQECSWCLRCVHFQTSSLFLLWVLAHGKRCNIIRTNLSSPNQPVQYMCNKIASNITT